MTRKQQPRLRGEQLLARFLDFSYESKEVKPAHIALYAHILTTYNKLGWPEEFALPTDAAMMRSHIANRQTYYRLLDSLIGWGWVKDCGRNGRECRRVGLLGGCAGACQSYGRALQEEEAAAPAAQEEPAREKKAPEAQEAPSMERFDRIFNAWSGNVTKSDQRWIEATAKVTGIRDFDLAMRLFKEHIVRNAKVQDWIDMSLSEKKSYFVNSSRFFATEACKAVKEVVAKVVSIGGRQYVEQYGTRTLLPAGHRPQPDVNYYWDDMWKNWRPA